MHWKNFQCTDHWGQALHVPGPVWGWPANVPCCGFWASENPSILTSFSFCARGLEKARLQCIVLLLCHQSLTAAFGEGTGLHIKPSEPKFRMAASYTHSTTKLSAGVGWWVSSGVATRSRIFLLQLKRSSVKLFLVVQQPSAKATVFLL